MIQLNRSIMEETVSIAFKPKNSNRAGRRTSAECESLDSADELAEVNPKVEEKHDPNSLENPVHIEEFVNLADQHVSFNDTVTVVNFSTPMDYMPPLKIGKLFSHNNS